MIVVTGAAGFIGSNLVADIKAVTDEPICVCDWNCRLSRNLKNHKTVGVFDGETTPEQLIDFLNANREHISVVIHMGAISSTTEHDKTLLLKRNVNFTMDLWFWCAINNVRFIYASSASVYGQHSFFLDSEDANYMSTMRPLNDYGWSKLAVDQMIGAMAKAEGPKPPQWVGLRFFNVYGPNEWHKGEQASLITKSYGKKVIKLFDVKAERDFVYVKDCTRYVIQFLNNPSLSGIYNIGTEQARPFEAIAEALDADVQYIPMPDELKTQYQFHTKASMKKLRHHGLWFPPTPLEDGIRDYVENYLSKDDPYR